MYRIALFFLLWTLASVAPAEIYKYVDDNGRVHFTDRPTGQGGSVVEPDGQERSNAGTRVRENGLGGSFSRASRAGQAAVGSDGIRVRVRKLLEEKDFEELDRLLRQRQLAAETDIRAEEDLYVAYDGFSIRNKKYESLFNAWVEGNPNSYRAYAARAAYFYELGWMERGNSWASETTEEQFEGMARYFRKAVEDVHVALKLNNQFVPAYDVWIGIANTGKSDVARDEIVKRALRVAPASFALRKRAMFGLTPRWGGSFDAMQAFIKEAQRYVGENPKLAVLKGAVYDEAADLKVIEDQYSVAEELYTKALSFGDDHETLMARARCRYRQENYSGAVDDLNRAIALYAAADDYYRWRSKAHSKLGQYDAALEDAESALEIDPFDERTRDHARRLSHKLKTVAYELRMNSKPLAAIDQYTDALRIAPRDPDIYRRRARAYTDLERFDEAFADLDVALRLNPDDIGTYQVLDWVLVQREEWDAIIRIWDGFIARHPENGKAYVERAGAYYHKGDLEAALRDAQRAAELGNLNGRYAYKKFLSEMK